MLFSNLFDDSCFSSPLDGKAQRRHSGETSSSNDDSLHPPKSMPQSLDTPGEHDQATCSEGGFIEDIALLVCSSNVTSKNRPAQQSHSRSTISLKVGEFSFSSLEVSNVAPQLYYWVLCVSLFYYRDYWWIWFSNRLFRSCRMYLSERIILLR